MNSEKKSQAEILQKLGIQKLNPMQEEAKNIIPANTEIVLLSPTGTGKTLAFLLPIIEQLDPTCKEIQVLIVVPSRELAIQIEQVIREMGTGYKANAVYGGRAGSQDKIELKHRPAILIGTPGRLADLFRKEAFSLASIQTLVLDEFDKSLEIGFEQEMMEITNALTAAKKTHFNIGNTSRSNTKFCRFSKTCLYQLPARKNIAIKNKNNCIYSKR
jgi:superfamily II DNA/RNA helicase